MTDSTKKALKDILIRAAKTFIECFGGTFVSALATLSAISDFGAVKKIFFSALSAGVSAMIAVVINSIINLVKVSMPEIDDEQITQDIEEALAELDKDKEDEANG